MKKHLFYSVAFAVVLAAVLSACKKDKGDQTIAVTGVTLNQSSAVIAIDSTLTLVATVAPSNATDTTVSWTSSNPAVATVDDGVVTPLADGMTAITVTTQDGGMTAACIVVVPGLSLTSDTGVVIDGTKWATRNVDSVGMFAATALDPGMFYQWNSATGWSATEPATSSPAGAIWDSAWDGNGATEWESANDPCPAGWRMPTNDELTALASAGSVGIPALSGRIFGSGANVVFLPAAGARVYSSGALDVVGGYGYYWSATSDGTANGFYLALSGFTVNPGSSDLRAYGFSVRCVAE